MHFVNYFTAIQNLGTKVHSYQISRYELRMNLAEKSVGLWLLLTNQVNENITIAYQALNDELVQMLNLKFSEQDKASLYRIGMLIIKLEQQSLSFQDLINYNKLINKQFNC